MAKRINYSRRECSLIPQGDMGALMHPEKLREYIANTKASERSKVIAFLYSIYTAVKLAPMIGYSEQYIRNCGGKHPEIVDAGQLGRNFAIADLSERRVIEMLQKLDVDRIPDEKKAKSIRDLMESADLARGQSRPKEVEKDEDVMELVVKVRQKISSINKVRDITDEVEVEKAVKPEGEAGKLDGAGTD